MAEGCRLTDGTHAALGQVQPTVGTGVFELRVRADGAYRVFYVVKFAEGMYVLHAFHKKGGQTARLDLAVGTERYRQLLAQRGGG